MKRILVYEKIISVNIFRVQHTLVNSSCFYIDVSEEEWTVLDFESFALERAKNGTTMVVDRKRINEDNELLVVKILLPIVCGSIFLVSLIIFILKYVHKSYLQLNHTKVYIFLYSKYWKKSTFMPIKQYIFFKKFSFLSFNLN